MLKVTPSGVFVPRKFVCKVRKSQGAREDLRTFSQTFLLVSTACLYRPSPNRRFRQTLTRDLMGKRGVFGGGYTHNILDILGWMIEIVVLALVHLAVTCFFQFSLRRRISPRYFTPSFLSICWLSISMEILQSIFCLLENKMSSEMSARAPGTSAYSAPMRKRHPNTYTYNVCENFF